MLTLVLLSAIHLHVEADREVAVYRSPQPNRFWRLLPDGAELVCTAPCDRTLLESSATYVVAGPSVTPSDALSLDDLIGDVVLRVHPGSSVEFSIGKLFVLSGSVLFVIGILQVLTTAIPQGGVPEKRPSDMDKFLAGAVVAPTGFALFGLGLFLFSDGKTDVDVAIAAP